MFASVRRYKANHGSAAEITARVQQGFVPIISAAPGFIAYYAIDAGDDIVASISIFQDQAGADDSSRLAADWVRTNVATLMSGPPETTAGTVSIYKTA